MYCMLYVQFYAHVPNLQACYFLRRYERCLSSSKGEASQQAGVEHPHATACPAYDAPTSQAHSSPSASGAVLRSAAPLTVEAQPQVSTTSESGEAGCAPVVVHHGSVNGGVERELNQTAARVLVPLSGGVDSTLLAVLVHRCVPDDEPIDLVNVCFAGIASIPLKKLS